ncbi:unnamed protein product [Cyprideis torosa]|uniref:Transcription initiation factor TFIID subunit 6 n=1 Tax=Cyprideis torosa TaxID=163714 RepID=A0A7R8WFQ5_9CRUS|nr:unnamed protein product [Cyprideis torosa]CAG0897180.1 unnamed protein product [Cyprideis torosa]
MDITTFPIDTSKTIAESIGVQLSDVCAREVSDALSFRLKQLVSDASKFMTHSKRRKLSTADIDDALVARNCDPVYGFRSSTEAVPFRFASGSGRDLFFKEEQELDISTITGTFPGKAGLSAHVRPHWLAIDGVQPSIPENPTPIPNEEQRKDATDPGVKPEKGVPGSQRPGLKREEAVKVKDLARHEISVEQQLYYKEITESCVGSEEHRRAEGLQSLASDPGLHQMIPRLCNFVSEGVRINVVQNNLALLIYLMRMLKALLENPSLYLERYLHELLPAVASCILSRQLCARPEVDNHFALRDFAARLMAQICRNFHTTSNGLQVRVTRMFTRALANRSTPMATRYGALAGLCEIGSEVIRSLVLPRVKFEGELIRDVLMNVPIGEERVAAEYVKTLLLRHLPPHLKAIRPLPDVVRDYEADYGYLGPQLHSAVCKLRASAQVPTSHAQGASSGGSGAKVFFVSPAAAAQNQQKFVVLSSNPPKDS